MAELYWTDTDINKLGSGGTIKGGDRYKLGKYSGGTIEGGDGYKSGR